MQNPVLDRRLIDCKELSEAWRKFLDLFNASIRGGDALSPENEQQFLECKSRIAMVHDSFMDSLKHDQQIGQNIYGIVTRCITMRHVHKMSPAETKKIEIEWHESYLLLNETVTSLEEEIHTLAQVNPTKFHIQRFLTNFKANLKAFFGSSLFKIALGAVVVLFVLFGIPAFGIYDYDNLRKVNGVNAVYFQFMNLKRMAISSTPYGKLSHFMTQYLPGNQAPDGYAYEGNADLNPKKDKMAANFLGIPLTGSDHKNMKDALNSSLEFEGRRLSEIKQSNTYVDVGCYCFYSNHEAVEIARQYNEFMKNYPPVGFSVFAMNNVLVILQGQDKTARQSLATKQFGQIVQ